MTSFLQFRLWARRGPAAEKAAVVVAGMVVLALAGWAAVPTDTGGSGSSPLDVAASEASGDGATVTQPAPTTPGGESRAVGAETSAAAGDGATGASATTGQTTSAGDPAGAVQGAGTGATACPSSSEQGVTGTEIHVATTVFNVFGANSTINIQSADEQKELYEAFWDTVNKAGGIHCRKVVGHYYEMNPLDQSSQQAGCLKIVADKRFALVGAGGFFPQSQSHCIPQNGIPIFQWYGLTVAEQQKYSPYVFSVQAGVDRLMRTWVLGARDEGFFDTAKGFAKLGVFQNNCDPDANAQLLSSLKDIGISGDKVNRFVADCPLSGQTPPNQCSQAAVQHRTAGVTHVFVAAGGSPNACYVNNANRQRFRPRYSTSDYIVGIGPPTVGETPDADAFDGALGITLTRFGHINAKLPVEPGTKWCNDALASHGLPTMEAENGNTLVTGTACAAVQYFTATVARAPELTRPGLARGLPRVGRVAFGFPASDAVFDRPGKVTGGDFYRVVTWLKACTCWKVTDPAYRTTA